jgi:hypothetical protein
MEDGYAETMNMTDVTNLIDSEAVVLAGVLDPAFCPAAGKAIGHLKGNSI